MRKKRIVQKKLTAAQLRTRKIIVWSHDSEWEKFKAASRIDGVPLGVWMRMQCEHGLVCTLSRRNALLPSYREELEKSGLMDRS